MKKARFVFAILVVAVAVGMLFAFNIKREKFRAETFRLETLYYYFTVTSTPKYYPINCVIGTPDDCTFTGKRYRKTATGYELYTGPAKSI